MLCKEDFKTFTDHETFLIAILFLTYSGWSFWRLLDTIEQTEVLIGNQNIHTYR